MKAFEFCNIELRDLSEGFKVKGWGLGFRV